MDERSDVWPSALHDAPADLDLQMLQPERKKKKKSFILQQSVRDTSAAARFRGVNFRLASERPPLSPKLTRSSWGNDGGKQINVPLLVSRHGQIYSSSLPQPLTFDLWTQVCFRAVRNNYSAH